MPGSDYSDRRTGLRCRPGIAEKEPSVSDHLLSRVARFEPRALGVRPTEANRVVAPRSDSVLRSLSTGWVGVPLVLALVANALNSKGQLGAFVPQWLKAATIGLSLVVVLLFILRRRVQWRWTVALVLALLYCAAIVGSTMFAGVPQQRFFLLAQFLGLTASLICFEVLRPGRGLGVLFWTAVIHCLLAVIINDETMWSDGRLRLEGGSHPILLGFEATMVFLIGLSVAAERHRRLVRAVFVAIAAFGAYVDVRAYSREDLIGAVLGLAVLVLALPGRKRWLRLLVMCGVATSIVLPLGVDGLVTLLGATSVQQLSTATGRTEVWQRLFSTGVDFPFTGYGYAALNDGTGPDARLYYASGGTPAENAVLQALLDGGVVGLVIWVLAMLALLLSVLRAKAPIRPVALAMVPMFAISISVSSDLAGEGLSWYWLLALAAAAAFTRQTTSFRAGAEAPDRASVR